MSGHVLLNLLNGLRKRDKMMVATSFNKNIIIHEHEC